MDIRIIEEYIELGKERVTSSKVIKTANLCEFNNESNLAFGEQKLNVIPVKVHKCGFRAFIGRIIQDNYQIWALMKTEKGNSHDEFWQDLYLVMKDGGPFSSILAETISQLDRSTGWFANPDMTYVEDLSEDLLNEWSVLYSGEEECRIIYAQKDDMLYRFDITII